ncbi:glucan biosynthesis protein D [Labrys sp. WJW]|uniref:glucan biosynthesis protein n=1 Tax=Labrys sp. WJW TaxID=1737983 RepID=UPI00082BBEBD|nr:glucan biosynthesis protein D [Labrys sp. WJW]OCC05074.1 glucan biosynthesis protein D [Labrys sp. WJW]
MNDAFDRRLFLQGAVSLSTLMALGLPTAAFADEGVLTFGPPAPFSFEGLVERAKKLAMEAYVPTEKPAPDITSKLTYEELGKIKFKTEDALWANGPAPFPVTFFHLGTFFQKKVTINVVEGKNASEIIYRKASFDMPPDSPAQAMPDGVGFAGFRFQEPRTGSVDWKKNDWVAFLGASYFRAIGELYQYGLSARGLAVNAADPNPPHQEEFPDFKEFWLEAVPGSADQVKVYALLDGPSVAGAFSFLMTRSKAVLMDIEAQVFTRNDISRFGLTPLTSMYWFSETAKQTAIDWRPEVHDSDGLAMWTGGGEHIWRPLNNVPATTTSTFTDTNPRGFGLLQRDRLFDHYLDGVKYDLRPSLWVEPLAPFGEGTVQLIEIPTNDEIHDNVVAMWVPKDPVKAGQQFTLKYRLHWAADEPFPTNLARVVATRLGNGGHPGTQRPVGLRKFVIEFLGDPLKDLPYGVKPEPIITASRGELSYIFTEAVPDGINGHWRAQFDLHATGPEPVELRCYLKLGDKVLSETWLYQYHPFV